ncbi:MAG: metallophosphoesterase [Clostridia bacterium]|nr:metallophosphoesterase [Clostridia bacterium]
MKKRFSKFLSVLLGLCMILSMASFTVVAGDSEAVTEYYVKFGGTGDGRSYDSPIGTIAGVIGAINADGHTAGDNVTVYLVPTGNEPTKEQLNITKATEGISAPVVQDTSLGFISFQAPNVAHSATITYTTYNYDAETDNKMILANGNSVSSGNNRDGSAHMYISGPSVFKDLYIIDLRMDGSAWDFYGQNHDVTIENVDWRKTSKPDANKCGYTNAPWNNHFYSGNHSSNKQTPATDANNETILDYAKFNDFSFSSSGTKSGNAVIRIGNDEKTSQIAILAGHNGKANSVHNGSISLVFNNTEIGKLTNYSGYTTTVENLQILLNNGSTIGTNNAVIEGNIWMLTAADGVTLDVTDTVGTFAVDTDKLAYAVADDYKTIYYGDANLTLPKGTYAVNVADDLDAVKESVDPFEDAANIFNGWIDDGNGKLTADYTYTDAKPTFYVQQGATGTGTSIDNPGSFATVVAKINGTYGAGDEVVIKIVKAANEADTYTDITKISLASIMEIPAHEAMLILTSADENDYSWLTQVNNYSLDNASNNSGNVELSGPITITKVKLLDPRNNWHSDFYANAHDLKICADIEWYSPKASGNTLNLKGSSTQTAVHGGSRSGKTFTTAAVVELESGVQLGNTNGLSLAGFHESATMTFNESLTFKIGEGALPLIRVNNMKGTACFKKNANIVFNGTTVDKVEISRSDSKGMTVDGAIQIVNNGGEIKAYVPDENLLDRTYYLTSGEGVALDVTETAGKFTVETEAALVYATAADGKTIYYGSEELALAAGTYEVLTAASVDEIVANAKEPTLTVDWEFAGWDTSVPGKITAKLTAASGETEAAFYVKPGATGDGTSADSPIGSVYAAVEKLNTVGYKAGDEVILYIMNGDVPAGGTKKFYFYDVNGNDVENKDVGEASTVYGNFAYWAPNGGGVPAHTATIVLKPYADEETFIAQHPVLGMNSNFTLAGPTVFENLTILTNRKYDRELFSAGNDLTITNCKFAYQNADHSGKSNGFGGVSSGHERVQLGGASAGTRAGGTVRINSAMKTTSTTYGLEISGTHATTFTDNVKVYVDHKDFTGNIVFARSNSTFNNGLALVINNGTPKCVDGGKGATVTVKNGFAVIANNGMKAPEIPSVSADKTWVLESEALEGSYLEPTEEAGTFEVVGDKVALATNEAGVSFLSGDDGLLTLPEGKYTVTYTDSVVTVDVYTDYDFYGTFPAGSKVLLPACDDTPVDRFVGWEDADGNEYVAGDYVTLPNEMCDFDLFSRWEIFEDSVAVWVDAVEGLDTNDGFTKDAPVKTLDKAFAILADCEETAKKAVVIGDYDIGTAFPDHTEMIIVTGDGSGESNIIMKKDNVGTAGPLTLSNINIEVAIINKFFETNSNKLIIGENVTYTAAVANASFNFHAGSFNKNSSKQELEISSPVGIVFVGSYYNSETRTTAGARIVINDGGKADLRFAADGWLKYGEQYGFVYTDTVTVIQNGGTYSASVDGKYGSAFEADLQIIANNGAKVPSLPDFPINGNHGLYVLSAEALEGCYLDATDVAGTFAVHGGKTALAVSKDGKQFISADGLLTVPAGTYTVTFEDEVYYTNEGTKIKFYKDFALDLATVPHSKLEGKLFVGWTYEDGTVPEDNNFVVGEELFAQYIDFDLDTDFYIEGAQIRLASAAKELGEGLRFVVRRTDASDALNIVEYGSVLAPSLAVGKDFVALDKTYTYNSKTYKAMKVPAEKIFAEGDGYEQYTVCVTNIANTNYAGMFTVRGYIIYEDLHGAQNVLYTDYYATNLVNIADVATKDPSVSEENKAYFSSLIETEKQRVKDKYAITNSNNTVVVPQNGYKDANLVAPVDISKYPLFTNFYQLNGAGGGLVVGEVTFETGREGVDPIEVYQLSDLHFNYCNAQDFEEANPSIMATYNGRAWNKNGSSVPNAVRSLEYASQGDAIVVTGDVLDYMSWGAIELADKYIWDTYPNAMVTLGNHEITRRCQDNPATPDPTTLESRQEILQDNWDHDIFYESKVIDDRLMLIQLDNSNSCFWESQVEPFEADLALAREKGYDVFLFYHIPLATGNSKDTDIYPIMRRDGYNYDFYNNYIGNPKTSGASKTVYDIIVNNGDIIKGTFCGHKHTWYYTEILAKTASGEATVIPQVVIAGTPYDGGHALKIIVK